MNKKQLAEYQKVEGVIHTWEQKGVPLRQLLINFNESERLPPIPPNVKHLTLQVLDNLRTLPPLPYGLKKLDIDICKSLPESAFASLPSTLTILTLNYVSITDLSILPQGLEHLIVTAKDLTHFPKGLFPNLKGLTLTRCSSLKSLHLPPKLECLCLSELSQLTEISAFPSSLHTIRLHYLPSITSLSEFPPSLKDITLFSIPLTSLPPFPHTNVIISITNSKMPESLLKKSHIHVNASGHRVLQYDETDAEWIARINPTLEELYVMHRNQMRCGLLRQELLSTALCPERVEKWLGDGDEKCWELVDTMMGVY